MPAELKASEVAVTVSCLKNMELLADWNVSPFTPARVALLLQKIRDYTG